MATRSGAQTTAPPTGSPPPVSGRNRAWVFVGALLLAGLGGFLMGSERSDVMELEGRAGVGERVATIESGGWSYGLSQSVAWIDASGSFHEDGWPDCLGSAGNTTNVRFGAVEVKVDSVGFRAVVYVDCRS